MIHVKILGNKARLRYSVRRMVEAAQANLLAEYPDLTVAITEVSDMDEIRKYTPVMVAPALVDGRPQVLQLKDTLNHFIEHRNEVVVRRSKFDLDAAEKRAHILEGYIIALDNIDAVVKIIRGADDRLDAQKKLMAKFKLSEIQTNAILDMRLYQLTGLERDKVEAEYLELRKHKGVTAEVARERVALPLAQKLIR